MRGIEGDYVVNKWLAKKRRLVIIALVAGAIGALTATAVAQTQRFPDVPVDHYAFEAVEWAAEVGVTTGYPDGTFKPEQPLSKRHAVVFMERYYDKILQAEESEDFTRGDMMVLLKAINDGAIDDTAAESDTAAGSPPEQETDQRFPDVPVDHYAYEAVEWAAEVGVTTGHADGTFKPEQPLIKRHAVVFMERYYDKILQAEESEDFTRGDMMVLLKAINDGTAAGSRPAEEALTPSVGEIVAAGEWHSCGVRTNGTVTCWGSNEHFGYHDSQPRWTADGKLDAPSGRFLSVTAGITFSCGVRVDRTIACWGSISNGKLNAPSGQFLSMTAGSGHSCSVRVDQSVVCWGSNYDGQSNAPSGQFLSVAAGGGHSCGVRVDGTVTCWGSGESFAYDDGETVWRADGRLDAPSGQFSYLAAGSFHTCGVRVDQSLTCWGIDQGGVSNVPAEEFLSVAGGNSHTCGVLLDRTLVCWDSDYHYYGDTAELVHPSLVRDPNLRYIEDAETAERRLLENVRLHKAYLFAPAGEFLSVAAGVYHACAVRVDRTAVCWGMNDQGQANAPTGQFGP